MDIVSKQGKLATSEQNLFAFLTDLRNLDEYIPMDKVKEWESSENECSIGMPQVGTITLRITEKEANNMIRIEPVSGSSPFSFRFYIQIKQIQENDTRIKLTLRADLNMMMRSMFQGPIKKGLDQIVDTLEQFEVPDITE